MNTEMASTSRRGFLKGMAVGAGGYVLGSSLVHPREVFKAAFLSNATCIVLGHNHPSGDPTPSPEDGMLTRRLKDAGELLGVELVDSIIVGDEDRYFSFRETGHMPERSSS